jgi:hypothetical protein
MTESTDLYEYCFINGINMPIRKGIGGGNKSVDIRERRPVAGTLSRSMNLGGGEAARWIVSEFYKSVNVTRSYG